MKTFIFPLYLIIGFLTIIILFLFLKIMVFKHEKFIPNLRNSVNIKPEKVPNTSQ